MAMGSCKKTVKTILKNAAKPKSMRVKPPQRRVTGQIPMRSELQRIVTWCGRQLSDTGEVALIYGDKFHEIEVCKIFKGQLTVSAIDVGGTTRSP